MVTRCMREGEVEEASPDFGSLRMESVIHNMLISYIESSSEIDFRSLCPRTLREVEDTRPSRRLPDTVFRVGKRLHEMALLLWWE